MPKVQYRGLSHYREFSSKDFENVGLGEGLEDLKIARFDLTPATNRNEVPQVVEVTDEQLSWLQKTYKGEWRVVSDERAAEIAGEEEGDGEEVEVTMAVPNESLASSTTQGSGETAASGSRGGRARR